MIEAGPLIEHRIKLDAVFFAIPGSGSRAHLPAYFLVMAKLQVNIPVGHKSLLQKILHRLQSQAEGALAVGGTAAPNEPVNDLPAKGIMLPIALGAGGHGHHVLMGHEQHRLFTALAAALPPEQHGVPANHGQFQFLMG